MKKTFLIALPAVILAGCAAFGQGTWTQRNNFGGSARYGAVAFSIGTKGYVSAGFDGTYRNDLWEWDPSGNTWTQKANFGGTARQHAVGFSIGSKGYVGTGNNYSTSAYYKDFWEYDPQTNSWAKKADFAGGARAYAVGFSIGVKGYICTGYENSSAPNYFSDLWEYDPVSDTWVQRAPFPGPPRNMAVAFSVGNCGFVATGDNGSTSFKDLWEWNQTNNSWVQRADLPGAPRLGAVALTIDNSGYLGTGWDGTALRQDFFQYDPQTDAWSVVAAFPGGSRNNSVAFSMGLTGYLGVGFDGAYKKDFWEFNPSSATAIPTGSGVSYGICIFPNPCSETLCIEISDPLVLHSKAEVYDVSGNLLLVTAVDQMQTSLSLPHLKNGTYFLRIIKDNTSHEYRKIVIKK